MARASPSADPSAYRYVASLAPMRLQHPLGKRVYASVSTQPFRTLFTISFSSADSIPSTTVSTLPARHTSRLTILSWRPLSTRGRLPPSRAGRSACPRQSSRRVCVGCRLDSPCSKLRRIPGIVFFRLIQSQESRIIPPRASDPFHPNAMPI